MWLLYQFPLCPFSRKVRLHLGEKGVGYDLETQFPWDDRDDFSHLTPIGETPVMYETEQKIVLIDSAAISEYFEETVEQAPMITGTAAMRAEIRRLSAMFDKQFYQHVTAPLIEERVRKRLVDRLPPDGGALRKAMYEANHQLEYVESLLDHRTWLAGATLSLADLSAAAQISISDYLGAIDWRGRPQAEAWYAGLKSRPSFRSLLAERMSLIDPPAHYDKVD